MCSSREYYEPHKHEGLHVNSLQAVIILAYFLASQEARILLDLVLYTCDDEVCMGEMIRHGKA